MEGRSAPVELPRTCLPRRGGQINASHFVGIEDYEKVYRYPLNTASLVSKSRRLAKSRYHVAAMFLLHSRFENLEISECCFGNAIRLLNALAASKDNPHLDAFDGRASNAKRFCASESPFEYSQLKHRIETSSHGKLHWAPSFRTKESLNRETSSFLLAAFRFR